MSIDITLNTIMYEILSSLELLDVSVCFLNHNSEPIESSVSKLNKPSTFNLHSRISFCYINKMLFTISQH